MGEKRLAKGPSGQEREEGPKQFPAVTSYLQSKRKVEEASSHGRNMGDFLKNPQGLCSA